METLNCDRARALMSERLDGRIAERSLADLNQHMLTCPACTARWQTMQRLSTLFEGAEMAPPPPDFTSRVMNRLAAAEMKRDEALHKRTMWLAGLAVATTALLLVVVAVTLTKTGSPALAAGGPALDIVSMSISASGAAIWLAAMTHGTLAIAGDIVTFVSPAVVVLFLLWLAAGTLALAVTVASLIGSYRPLERARDETP